MHFRRLSQDWEMEGVSQYWEFIYKMKVREEGGGIFSLEGEWEGNLQCKVVQ